MHWADIFAKLQKLNISMTDIAKEENVSVTTVSEVIKGSRTSYRIASIIAGKTNTPMNNLWPGKYTEAPKQRKAS